MAVIWDILGISPTRDVREIKKAYAALAKKNNPEEHPDEFRRIHDAYKSAMAYARAPVITPAVVADTGENAGAPRKDESFIGLPQRDESSDESGTVEYDFSSVGTHEENSLRIVTYEEKIKAGLLRIEVILKDPTLRNSAYIWQNFFSEGFVHDIINDKEFRTRADELIGKIRFNKSAAEQLVLGFGGKSKYHFDINTCFAFFDMTGRRKRSYYLKSTEETKATIAVVITAIGILAYAIIKAYIELY